jgi:lysine 2,3-aminomutase
LVNEWWNDYRFHLRFAIRDYKTLNYYMDQTLSPKKLEVFDNATEKGLPFFINFYYLSLLVVNSVEEYVGSDMPIRDYIFYNKDLIEEFGNIVAWEKEDVIVPGKPNAAGWLLPNEHNIHRRYPETAIFIPDTMGRSCGGLCVSCQRMYDFQKGHLNFNLEQLKPEKSWNERLVDLLKYYENDTHLRDILITGGDSFMSSNNSLKHILDEVYAMIVRKNKANQKRPVGEKYAPMERVRLGTRLPVYIPQRIDDELIQILTEFRAKASKQGVKKFVIQTHFITAMEITPEAEHGINMLLKAGWMVTNQSVFTTSVSRKGHVAKLRSELNKVGVLPYYSFSVKGFKENKYNFATNARLAQELFEEKVHGFVGNNDLQEIIDAKDKKKAIHKLMQENDLPFIATDRSVMNMPALGKSLTFSVIGITFDGRRILRFRHDAERKHSPMVGHDDDVIIVESKSVNEYIQQLEKKGEMIGDYENLYGYSIFATEKRKRIFEFVNDETANTKNYNHFEQPVLSEEI